MMTSHSAFTSEVKYVPHENNDSIRSRMMRLGDIMEIEDANGPLRIWLVGDGGGGSISTTADNATSTSISSSTSSDSNDGINE